MSETFYELLDVPPDASREEIRTAYREMVKETHPDVSDDPDAERQFKTIKRAKEVLTDPVERATYDRQGHERYVGSDRRESDVDDTDDVEPSSSEGRTRTSEAAEGNGTKQSSDGTRTNRSSDGTRTNRSSDGTRTNRSADGARRERSTGTHDGTSGRTPGGGSGSSATDPTADERRQRSATRQSRTATDGVWGQTGSSIRSGGTGSRTAGSDTSYATRSTASPGAFDSVRLPLSAGSLVELIALFLLYPVFVLAAVFPPLPLAVNVFVGLCTLFVVGYMLSIPEVAMGVFGIWGVASGLILVVMDGVGVLSLYGLLAVIVFWVPFGLAVLLGLALRL